jgi:uncharacterized protein YdeI (YjbR/CyaY-like superfamily)
VLLFIELVVTILPSTLHRSISLTMPPKALPTDLPIRSFSSLADFEAFLEPEHATSSGVYLQLAKKGSGIPSISSKEAIEVALCFGWIDGRAQSVDDNWWLSRYTPRRPKSIWSQKNVGTIARLMEEGKLRPAGIAAVDAAKADGRWERAYAGSATITVPEDLAASLVADPASLAFFQSLNKSDRYSVLWRVETASPKSRAHRVKSLVEMLATGRIPGALAPLSKKSRQNVGDRKRAVSSVPEKEDSKTSKKSEEIYGADVRPSVRSRRAGLRRRT